MSVYFAQRRKGGLIKIGWSRSVPLRIIALKAKLLGSIKGERSTEKRIHKKFSHLQVRGEWYSAADELLEYIRTEAQEHTPDSEMIQTVVRLSKSFIKRLDKLAEQMSQPGLRVTRTGLLRYAVNVGVAKFEAELKKR